MRHFLTGESGAVSVQNLVFFLLFIAVGGLALDVANAYRMRSIMQATSDSAALSGAMELPSNTAAASVANTFVRMNMPESIYGTLAHSDDFEIGDWDPDTRTFTQNPASGNAILVTLSRNREKSNALPATFLSIIGVDYWNITTRSLAVAQSSCNGIVANNKVEMGQDVRISPGVCVYGRNGIRFGQDAYVSPESQLGTLAPFNLSTGQSPSISDGSIFTGDQTPPRALRVPQIIDGWEVNGFGDYTVHIVNKLPNKLVAGSLYIVNGNVKIDQDYATQDVIIAARGNVSWGQDGALRNTVDCLNDRAIGLYATGNISFGQDAIVSGIDLVAGNDIVVGQDVRSMQATLEAGNDVKIEQDPHFKTCRPLEQAQRLAGLRH